MTGLVTGQPVTHDGVLYWDGDRALPLDVPRMARDRARILEPIAHRMRGLRFGTLVWCRSCSARAVYVCDGVVVSRDDWPLPTFCTGTASRHGPWLPIFR